MYLRKVSKLGESFGVPEEYEDDAMVSERRERRHDGRFMPAPRGRGGDEHGREFAEERAARPELARRVPEVLPLDREVRESSGDAKDEHVELDKVARGGKGVVRLGRCAEFLKEILRKGL